MKYNHSAETAINQIKNNRYLDALRGYVGEIVLVGVNYDKKSKQHKCVIEKIDSASLSAPQNAPQKLSVRQQKIIALIRENPFMSKEKMADELGLSFDMVKRDLAAMSDIVRYSGSSKRGEWKINGEILWQ